MKTKALSLASVVFAVLALPVDGPADTYDDVANDITFDYTTTDFPDYTATRFAPGINGTWMLTAFAELASGSADGLDDTQVKVYAADTLAGLASAEPMASGVVVTNKAPAVKVELEVTPPANADAQFFRVGFGE